MKATRVPSRRGFWLWWLLATTVGWGIGVVSGVAAINPVYDALGGPLAALRSASVLGAFYKDLFEASGFLVGGLIFGAAVAIPQWLVLRRADVHLRWWIPITSLGWALGWGLYPSISGALGWWTFTMGLGGALVGLLQGLALRWRGPRLALWLSANVAGAALGWWAVMEIGPAGGLLGGMVSGALVGLAWLEARRPATQSAPARQPD